MTKQRSIDRLGESPDSEPLDHLSAVLHALDQEFDDISPAGVFAILEAKANDIIAELQKDTSSQRVRQWAELVGVAKIRAGAMEDVENSRKSYLPSQNVWRDIRTILERIETEAYARVSSLARGKAA